MNRSRAQHLYLCALTLFIKERFLKNIVMSIEHQGKGNPKKFYINLYLRSFENNSMCCEDRIGMKLDLKL